MFSYEVALPGDLTPAVLDTRRHQLPELAENGLGFRLVAADPYLFGTRLFKFVNRRTGSAHFLAVRVRFCWCLGCWYLGFCYPDRSLLQNTPEFLAAVRRLAAELVPGGQVRAYLTSLDENEYSNLCEFPTYEEYGSTDPEGLREFTQWERHCSPEEIGVLQSRSPGRGAGSREWCAENGAIVRIASPDQFDDIHQLQNTLNGRLGITYPAMYDAIRTLLDHDWAVSSDRNRERLLSHGAVLVVLDDGLVAATGWFYHSYNVPRARWELWGRRWVVNPHRAGRGYGRLLWDAAVGLLAPALSELRVRTLVHPNAHCDKPLRAAGFTPVCQGRSRYVCLSAV